MKIGCRAHDYGKHPTQELALILHNAGYQAAQVAVPKAIEGINDYQHISPEQLEILRSGFAAHDVEISVLGCYQDLSDPDAEKRAAAVQNVCRVLGWQHLAGGRCVGSETSYLHLDAEERAARREWMFDSVLRIVETAAKTDAIFAVEPVYWHPLDSMEVVQQLIDRVADPEHLHFIFDPANVLENHNILHQTKLWNDWLSLIGSRIDAIHVKDFTYGSTGTYDTYCPTPLGKGCIQYAEISKWLHQQSRDIPLLREEVILNCAAEDIAFMSAL